MTTNDILLYIGAGYDHTPLSIFRKIKIFVFTDLDANTIDTDDELINSHVVYKKYKRIDLVIKRFKENFVTLSLKFNNDFDIVKEKKSDIYWHITFKNKQEFIYIFNKFPFHIKIKAMLCMVTILYVQNFKISRNDIKDFPNIHTIYWSKENPKYFKNVEKEFYDKKIIYIDPHLQWESDLVPIDQVVVALKDQNPKITKNDIINFCKYKKIEIKNGLIDYKLFFV